MSDAANSENKLSDKNETTDAQMETEAAKILTEHGVDELTPQELRDFARLMRAISKLATARADSAVSTLEPAQVEETPSPGPIIPEAPTISPVAEPIDENKQPETPESTSAPSHPDRILDFKDKTEYFLGRMVAGGDPATNPDIDLGSLVADEGLVKGLSRRHIKVRKDENGRYFLSDAGSHTATFGEGVLTGETEIKPNETNIIKLGLTKLGPEGKPSDYLTLQFHINGDKLEITKV